MSQMKDIKGTHLKTNIKKIKEIIIVIVNKTIGTVQKSRYLGSIFDDGGTLEDVKNRIKKTNNVIVLLYAIWKSNVV